MRPPRRDGDGRDVRPEVHGWEVVSHPMGGVIAPVTVAGRAAYAQLSELVRSEALLYAVVSCGSGSFFSIQHLVFYSIFRTGSVRARSGPLDIY